MPVLAFGPKADELEEETQPGGIQTEVGWRDYTVRQFQVSLSSAILTYLRTQLGELVESAIARVVNRKSRQTAEVALYHRCQRLTRTDEQSNSTSKTVVSFIPCG